MRRDRFVLASAACLVLAMGCGSPPPLEANPPVGVAESDVVAYRLPIVLASDVEAEIAFYTQRISKNPSGGLDLANLAAAYIVKARRTHDHRWLSEAEQAAQTSLENLPMSNPLAKLVLAKVAQEHHDFEQALRLAGEILADRPGHESALAIATTSHFAVGDMRSALATVNQWVDLNPAQASLSHRAVILAASGRDSEALFDFNKALESEQPGEVSASAWTRTMLGRFHQRRGRPQPARRLYREARRIQPGSVLASAALADLEARFGDHHESERLYDEIHRQTGEAMWLARKGTAVAAHGHRRDARRLWAAAAESLREDLAVGHTGHRRDLANLLLDRGKPEDVAEALALARADASIRRDAETVLTYSHALIRAGQVADARVAVHEALAAGLKDARLYERAAHIERIEGHTARAELYEARVRSLSPSRDSDKIASSRPEPTPAALTIAVKTNPAPDAQREHRHGPGGHTH